MLEHHHAHTTRVLQPRVVHRENHLTGNLGSGYLQADVAKHEGLTINH
jgi:hypothetical protein